VQVCPTGALAEKGFAAEEMVKRQDLVERLATIRGTMNPGGSR
jgi:NADH dehydrogenase/NADH:ubiquinone oxidoreductase subunit G